MEADKRGIAVQPKYQSQSYLCGGFLTAYPSHSPRNTRFHCSFRSRASRISLWQDTTQGPGWGPEPLAAPVRCPWRDCHAVIRKLLTLSPSKPVLRGLLLFPGLIPAAPPPLTAPGTLQSYRLPSTPAPLETKHTCFFVPFCSFRSMSWQMPIHTHRRRPVHTYAQTHNGTCTHSQTLAKDTPVRKYA